MATDPPQRHDAPPPTTTTSTADQDMPDHDNNNPPATATAPSTNDGDQQQQQQQKPPPDSPPLPQKHVAATPGRRATRLRDLYAQALDHTLGKLAWDNVAACYPTVSGRAEGVLRQVQGQMVGKLGEKCEKEFDNIMVSRQVVPKLNELEALIADASQRRSSTDTPDPIPPHLLPPDRILAAHLHPALTSHQSQLNARLQTTQSQNAILYDQVQQQRDEIEDLLAQLEAVVRDVRGANESLADVVEQLAVEAREGKAAVASVAQSQK